MRVMWVLLSVVLTYIIRSELKNLIYGLPQSWRDAFVKIGKLFSKAHLLRSLLNPYPVTK